jgi:hypothetical protein
MSILTSTLTYHIEMNSSSVPDYAVSGKIASAGYAVRPRLEQRQTQKIRA